MNFIKNSNPFFARDKLVKEMNEDLQEYDYLKYMR